MKAIHLRCYRPRRTFSVLTHVNSSGKPEMVDVSSKGITTRIARAEGRVLLPSSLMDSLSGSEQLGQGEIFTKKGPVFATAIVAGTQAVKRTSDLIPFCHSIAVESCKFDIVLASLNREQTEAALGRYSHAVKISCEVKCEAKTGVEMEALVGVSNAALCVYDMLKAASHDMLITDICLVRKSGGKSDFNALK